MAQQWASGERITADKLSTIVGEPVIRDTNSATFTGTEVVLDTLTVSVVSGRRYKLVWDTLVQSSDTVGYCRGRLRETNVSGTVLQLRQTSPASATGQGWTLRLEAFWTAASTGSMTFVATGQRQGLSGTLSSIALGAPTLFYAENS